MRFKKVFELLEESIAGWSRNQASIFAAALAYYTIFSLAPLVIIAAGIAGLVFSQTAVLDLLVDTVEDLVGPEIALFIEQILISSQSNNQTTGIVATFIGILILVYAASIIFFKLQVSLNAMWDIVPKMENISQNILVVVRARLLSAAAVLAAGLYLLVALVLSNIWTALPKEIIHEMFPNSENWAALLSFVISPVMYMIPFALIYRLLPQAKVTWRDVWLGAAIAAVLFWIGGQLIGWYFTRSGVTSVYGAAGSLVAFLIWIFYSGMVFLFGAKFTQVFADKYGTPIVPDATAMFRPGLVSDSIPQEESVVPDERV